MPEPTGKAVFLSYASQDAEAVLRIAEALRAAGVEVWFDRDELVGGDAWDAKIRGQIAACALFVPVISAATQARLEGYFRIEWKLAAQRTHAMAEEKAFLLPVVIDDTRDAAAKVPAEFRAVQWTRLPGGESHAVEKFCVRVGKILAGDVVGPIADRAAGSEVGAPLDGARGRGRATPLPKPARSWLLPALIAGAVIAALAIWQPWKTPGRPPLSVQLAAPATPDSKAASLVARARAIYETGLIANEEDLKLAERFAREATEVEPFNAEAWAARSLASAQIFNSRFDASDVRRAEVLTAAQRAVKLDPDSATAKLALAISLRQSRDTEPEAGRIAQELAARPDASGMALLLQARLLLAAGDAAGVATVLERLLAIPGFAAQWHYWKGMGQQRAGRGPEAAAEFARAIALVPDFAMAQSRRLGVLMALADREELRRALKALPARLKTDSRLAGELFVVHWLLRDGDKAARALETLPQEYIEAGSIRGPKAMYLGLAHRVAGRREAAVVEWQGALRTVDKRLAAGKTDPDDVIDRAWLLALLGREAEALDSLRLYEQLRRIPVGRPNNDTVMLYAELGREELVATFFTEAFSNRDARVAAGGASFYLLMDCFDRYRELPRFRELNRRAEELFANARLPAGAAKAVPSPAAAVVPKADDKSVAVMAFKNVGSDPANEALVDGIGLELISVLGRVQGLTVRGGSSLEFSKTTKATAQEKGRQLAATYLVDGSVQRGGDTVRITASVTRAATNEIVWTSAPLNRDVKNFFAVQEEIAGLIAQALSLKLTAGSTASTAAVNPQAMELYLQGRAAWRTRTVAGEIKAEELFRQALALDPKFARGHAGLADVWLGRAQRENSAGQLKNRNDAVMDQALASAQRALKLDDSLAEAHLAVGSIFWMDWKVEDASREFRTAVALNPSDATAHQRLGRALLTDGRIDEALVALRRAHELEPLFARIADNYSIALIGARRFEEAVAMADRALALQPELRQGLAYKAVALAEMGRTEDAIAAARRYTESAGPLEQDATPTWVSYALARAKASREAEQLLARVPAGKRQAVAAAAWLALGKREEAFTVFRDGSSNVTVADVLLWWPVFDAVREEPEFKAMIAAMGFTEAHARAQAWRAAHPPEKVEVKK